MTVAATNQPRGGPADPRWSWAWAIQVWRTRADDGDLSFGFSPSSDCARLVGSSAAIASLQGPSQLFGVGRQQAACAAGPVQCLADQVGGHAGRDALGDRDGHVSSRYSLPPRHLFRVEVLVVDDVKPAASTADATVSGDSEVDAVGIDVTDLPHRQCRVVAQTRLGRARP